ncbi:MFS transporter [Streptomyces sp. NPDC005393]|uniref:MFS transporter n=1 Tax=Streptomyces sp. NPDC005393 TaxID=3157041 RepID=UPI0033BE8F0A
MLRPDPEQRRKRCAGLAVFGLASLGCGLAPATGALIVARGAQGVGGAAMSVTAFALIGSVYRGPDLGKAMGVFGAVTGLGAAAGPMAGGVLTQYLSWRAAFFANIPLVLITLALTRAIPAPAGRPERSRLDLPGTAAFAV